MADILMCQNNKCELKDGCWRFIAPPSKYIQSYMLIDKKINKPSECECYWKLEE